MNTRGQVKISLILAIANSLVIVIATGVLVYTRIIFKRPAITEEDERTKLANLKIKRKTTTTTATIVFEAFTANIVSVPAQPKADPNSPQQLQGKMHYATVAFSLEILDERKKDAIENLRPYILDKLLNILGHKTFQEMTNVQGRYVLRNEIIDAINHMTVKAGLTDENMNLISNLHFTQFVVQ